MLERVAEWVLFSLMEEPISTNGTAEAVHFVEIFVVSNSAV
jgi:hypothetical protein